MITYVCCYNNQQQLNEMLLRSDIIKNSLQLTEQSQETNRQRGLLLIETKGRYCSAASALNTELGRHNNELGDILVFVHQDIVFDDCEFETTLIKEFEANPNQIIGLAGMLKTGKVVSNLKYFKNKQYIVRTQIIEKTQVASVDECCFAMPKTLWEKIRFDEKICAHWHLYAVNFCYESAQRLASESYVIPVNSVYHKETGGGGLFVDSHFLWSLWKMRCKYRNAVTIIHTPCYIVPTRMSSCCLRIFKTLIGNIVKKYLCK